MLVRLSLAERFHWAVSAHIRLFAPPDPLRRLGPSLRTFDSEIRLACVEVHQAHVGPWPGQFISLSNVVLGRWDLLRLPLSIELEHALGQLVVRRHRVSHSILALRIVGTRRRVVITLGVMNDFLRDRHPRTAELELPVTLRLRPVSLAYVELMTHVLLCLPLYLIQKCAPHNLLWSVDLLSPSRIVLDRIQICRFSHEIVVQAEQLLLDHRISDAQFWARALHAAGEF